MEFNIKANCGLKMIFLCAWGIYQHYQWDFKPAGSLSQQTAAKHFPSKLNFEVKNPLVLWDMFPPVWKSIDESVL